jgi:hydroxymethylglutaryl-CoA reductase
VLPWLVRGRSLALDVVVATTWAAGLAATTGAVAQSLTLGDPRGLAAGAVLAGALALIGARARDTVNAAHDRV